MTFGHHYWVDLNVIISRQVHDIHVVVRVQFDWSSLTYHTKK
jgi:hypothetical protein